MKRVAWFLLLTSLFLAAACGGGAEGGDDAIVVEAVWGRPLPNMAQNGAFYMTITNNTGQDDVLQSVRTEACGMVELHRSSVNDEGVMQMRPVEGQTLPIRSGQTVALAPNGLHVMCMNVPQPFETGQTIPLTLVFENAGEMALDAEIREEPPQ